MIRKVILIIMLLIVATLVYYYVTDWRYRKFDPKINPHPKYFMTIKGKVAPSLAGKVPVRFLVQYITLNPECDIGKGTFSGATASRMKVLSFWANSKNRRGDFILKIPIDKYKPGICKWQFAAINFQVGDIGETTLFTYSQNAKILDASGAINIDCSRNGKNCDFGRQKNFNSKATIALANYQYLFYLGIKR